MTVLTVLLIIVVGYLLGNFSTGILVSRLQSGLDIRKHGSGNAGATNVLRVLGSKPALLTFLGDMIKGVLAVLFGLLLGGRDGGLIGGAAAVLGHNWPVFFGFKGGKGVATSFAALLVLFPWQGLITLVVFIAVVYCTRYVSLASMLGGLVYAALVIATHWGQWLVCAIAALLALLIVWRHRTNISRLLHGTESKLDFNAFRKRNESV